MNVHVLIDAIVRQTTVLVAQLATAGGARASLSQTANQVFLDLAAELRQQGLGNKLIADMFGLSLRTYHNKVKRLSESRTDRGRSLWTAVLDFVQAQGTVARKDVLMRFCRDDDATVRSVLNDLVETGLVFSKGSEERMIYRAASPAEFDPESANLEAAALGNLLWIMIARHSPIRRSQLLELTDLDGASLDAVLDTLVTDGRVSRTDGEPESVYQSEECVIAVGAAAGWEASVFDHYQAMVVAICRKLASGKSTAEAGEWLGGSTYGYEVWPGHPLHDEAVGFLQSTRTRAADLRIRIDEYNRTATVPRGQLRRVVAYVGQSVVDTREAMENDE